GRGGGRGEPESEQGGTQYTYGTHQLVLQTANRQRDSQPQSRPARKPVTISAPSSHQPRPRPKEATSEALSGPSTTSTVSSSGRPGVVFTPASAEKEVVTPRQTVSVEGSSPSSSSSGLGWRRPVDS